MHNRVDSEAVQRKRRDAKRGTKISLDGISEEELGKRIFQMGEIELKTSQEIRPAIMGNKKVSIKVRTLNSDFTCPICLGILRDTMTVMECLHRFCRECIELSIRMGQKQCPACRTRVPSRRNLRKDEYFDSLIAKIYPDLDKVSEEEENEINQLISEHNTGAYIESVEQGCRTQDSTRRTRVEFTGGGNSRHGSNRKGKSFRGRHVAKPKDMRIGFRMQPNEDAKYLRCLRSATISQMQSYLNIKFERKGPFEISLRKNRRIICQDHQTLDEIAKMAEGEDLVLEYALQRRDRSQEGVSKA